MESCTVKKAGGDFKSRLETVKKFEGPTRSCMAQVSASILHGISGAGHRVMHGIACRS